MDFLAAAYQLEADAQAMSESLINRVAPALASGLIDVTGIRFTIFDGVTQGARNRRHLPDIRTRAFRCADRMESRSLVQRMLPLISFLIQNLERGYRRRKYRHVASGRPDDFSDCRAGGNLHALASRRRAPLGVRCGFCHRR